MGWCRQWLLLIMVLLATTVGQVEARSLHWRELDVTARLDADGRLHVRERQVMVFSGDWNGGERRFRVPPGQRLEFTRIARVDPVTGVEIPLQQGRLTATDRWDWQGRDTVRWRSRLPSDPVFSDTAIVYVLEYTLTGILLQRADGYLFDHDFAFPDRTGEIERFHLDLALDPVWQAQSTLPPAVERAHLAPGESVVLTSLLRHTQGEPAFFSTGAEGRARGATVPAPVVPAWLRPLLLAGLWLLFVLKAIAFCRHEARLGRFAILAEPVDRAWVKRHMLALAPEVVGATWDKTTGAAEVAAVIARLVQEGKMASRVEHPTFALFGHRLPIPGGPILHLTLQQERSRFKGYERRLVDGLFVRGDTTDTRLVRNYYREKNRSFDPVDRIRQPLEARVQRLTGTTAGPWWWSWIPSTLLFVLGLLLMVLGSLSPETFADARFKAMAGVMSGGFLLMVVPAALVFWRLGAFRKRLWVLAALLCGWSVFLLIAANLLQQQDLRPLLLPIGVLLVCWSITAIVAHVYCQRAEAVRAWALLLLLFGGCLLVALSLLSLRLPASALHLAGLACVAAAWINATFNQARSKDTAAGIDLRRRLAAARAWCRAQLAREQPELDDTWFPYLLAFGLGPQVDSWFRAFGAVNASAGGGLAGQADSMGGFSGGGGAFGGAGAAGAWGAAASGFAAAASSSSSSSSGGGGGSSGGGGGGGW
jgi:uncharacterized membrane protein YgcG